MPKKPEKRVGRGGIEIEDLGDIELSEELDAQVWESVNEAEEELTPISVNFRWNDEQLKVVKKVAQMMGVPYQTYIKMIVYKQALIDLHLLTGRTVPPTKTPKTRK